MTLGTRFNCVTSICVATPDDSLDYCMLVDLTCIAQPTTDYLVTSDKIAFTLSVKEQGRASRLDTT